MSWTCVFIIIMMFDDIEVKEWCLKSQKSGFTDIKTGGILVYCRPVILTHSLEHQLAIAGGGSIDTRKNVLFKFSMEQLRLCEISLLVSPAQRSCWGVYWFHSIRPSVHPYCIPCPLCSVYSFGWIQFISILLSSNFWRYVACKVSCKIIKFQFLAIFLKFVTLTLSCFDLGSDVNH